ncbi:MAG: glycosyltransferase family A protein [Cyanobacteria bacterium P01_A01_bin.70]
MVAVSVVIPAYNAEKTIKETIDSVLAQTFQDFEAIVINDGSTDNTLNILKAYSDDRLKIFSFENSGPQKSRNRGLAEAQGKYISFIDADDMWTADKLELQLKTLESNPDVSVVYSWSDVVNEESVLLRQGGHLIRRGDVFVDLLLVNFVESGSNFLAETTAVRNVGGFDEAIVAGQDRDILLSLANKYQIDVVPKTQVFYRKSSSSKSWSSNIQRTRAGIEQVISKHSRVRQGLEAFQKKGLSNAYKHMIFECLNNHPSRQKGICALNLLWMIIINDLNFITKGAFAKTIARTLITILLSEKLSGQLIAQFPKIFDITSVYGYFITEKYLVSKGLN